MTTQTATRRTAESIQALVAIALAARLTRDRDLERVAVWQLREEFGIRLGFLRNSKRGAAR